MQQVIAGMTDLSERILATEVRAAEAERQAQATQQELMRSQARAKGKRKDVTVSPQQKQGSARLRRNASLCRLKARMTSGKNGLEFFAVGLDD